MTSPATVYPSAPSALCECGCGGATSIADKTYTSRGVFRGKPNRFIVGHQSKRSQPRRRMVIEGESCCLLRLSSGMDAIVDADLFDDLSVYTWTAKSKRGAVYAGRGVNVDGKQRTIYLHAAVFGAFDSAIRDHFNRNTLDNRRSNLRTASDQQNKCNRGPQSNNKSGFKGVCRGKWFKNYKSQIQVAGKNVHIGYFDTEVEAAIAYNRRARELHGEFAFQNEVSCG